MGKAPNRDTLKRLFLQKVSFPVWWFTGLCNDDGTPVDFPSPSWLRGCKVVPMVEERWQGYTAKGAVSIVDDPKLGVQRMRANTNEK